SLTNPIHTYTETGIFEVTLTIVSTFNECPNTFTTTVEVIDKPIAGIDSQNSFGCSPLMVDFHNNSEGAVAYQLDWGDGNTENDTSAILQHEFISTVDTTFIVTLIAFNSAGCKDSIQFPVPVTAQPIPNFVASEYNHCDAPVVIELINQSEGGTSFEWFVNGISESNSENASVLLSDVDDYLIELLITNPFGCESRVDTTVRIVPQAEAALTVDSFKVCEGEHVTFNNASLNSTEYFWSFGDNNTSTEENPTHLYESEGIYDLMLIASFDGLCPDTLPLQNAVTVTRSPIADFTYENMDDPTPTGTIDFLNLSEGGIYYYWDFGDTKTSEEENPTHRYDYFGDKSVTLIAENEIGCQDTAFLDIELTFFKGLFVPNAFTPSIGPPDVRTFIPKGVNLEDYEIRIYDKWNGLVFFSEATDNGQPSEAWDGTHIKNGESLPQGAYVWEILAVFADRSPWEGKEYEKDKQKMVGSVMLIR
ncbi:MAG: PKD domain-containing protein, partial [Chitinophagales bacterium]